MAGVMISAGLSEHVWPSAVWGESLVLECDDWTSTAYTGSN